MEGLNAASEHALLNSVVLDNLFRHCKFEELDVCRNVCKKWRKDAEKHWLKKCPSLDIVSNDLHRKITSINVFDERNPDDDMWAVTRYNKFHVQNFSLGNNWNNVHTLWKTHGHLITHLQLSQCGFTTGNAFMGIFFCKATPILEMLRLTPASYRFEKRRRRKFLAGSDTIINPVCSMRVLDIVFKARYPNLPIPWERVFEGFPRLEILALTSYGTEEACELTRVFDGFKSFYKKNGACHPLKKLDVAIGSLDGYQRMPFPDAMLKFLREEAKEKYQMNAYLKLQTLVFAAEISGDKAKIDELVALLSKTLKRLKIYENILTKNVLQTPAEKFNLPYMEYLTRLDLWDCRIVNFKFLKSCPNLRQLNIILFYGKVKQIKQWNAIKDDMPDWGNNEKENLLLPLLTSFHCNLLMDWSKDDMLQLHSWMPGLSSLLIHANATSFEGLCQCFTKLKRLYLYNAELTDASFTGIHNNQLKLEGYQPEAFRKRANITDMKVLEVLGVRRACDGTYSNTPKPAMLTEFSASHGLLQLSTLRAVYLSSLSITSDGFLALKNNDDFKGAVVRRRFADPVDFVLEAVTPF